MSNGERKVRTLPWLKARSAPALKSPYGDELVEFARGLAPNGAYIKARETMYLTTGEAVLAEELAKACRFLSMIKRDHGQAAFDLIVSSVKQSTPNKHGQKGTKMTSRVVTSEMPKIEVKPEGVVAPSIPLKHLTYRAAVNGAFAQVKCIQGYTNDAQHPVEAVYAFPMPDEATVTGCMMKIGQRRVEAELKKRVEARQEYDTAVAAGHHASLLEQDRPNILTMNVGGIEPGENITVEVDYVQRIPWQAGGGRFTIPLVVAPRFIPGTPTGKQAGGWAKDTDQVSDASRITPPVAREGVSYSADISVMFSPGFRCRVSSPSHPVIITEQVVVKTDTVELKTGDLTTDRDFILTYRSLSKVPEMAVHRGEFKGENFVLASIIPSGEAIPVVLDIVALLDCSGSMDGVKLDGLKLIAKKVVARLTKENIGYRLAIIAFENQPYLLQPLTLVGPSLEPIIDNIESRGGTMLGPALSLAYSQFTDSARPKVILLVTDGQTESLQYAGSGAQIVAIGIDAAVNDTVIRNLARQTNGTCELVYPGEDYDAVAGRITGYFSGPVLRETKVDATGEIVGVSDVFKGRPATIAVRSTGKAKGFRISGLGPNGQMMFWDIEPTKAADCDFASQIWAREFIRENPDESRQTEASLKYGVICRHTSFVAVSLKQVPGQKPVRVEIPVNLPYGWDWEKVFGKDKDTAFIGAVNARGAASLGRRITAATLSGASFMEASGPIPGSRRKKIPKPQPPVTPKASMSSLSRFTLDAKDIVDRIIGILVVLVQGRRQEAEKAFAALKQELTPHKVSRLSEKQRAMLYYFVLRLAGYGLWLSADVLIKLTPRPKSSNALAWYNLGLKEIGRPYYSEVPADHPAADYLNWKFGKTPRPQTGDWAIVP